MGIEKTLMNSIRLASTDRPSWAALALRPRFGHVYDTAEASPAPIERLCQEWADVVRAILARRGRT